MQMTKFDLRSKWPVLAEVILEHGSGWHGVLDKILASMKEAGFDEMREKITPIKEKFGTIRVYVSFDRSLDGGIERIERIRKAMNEADKSQGLARQWQVSHLVVTEGWIMSRYEQHKPPNAKTLKEHFKR